MTRLAARGPWLAIAAALVLLPALPVSHWVGAPDQGPATWNTVLKLWGLGGVIVAVVALMVGRAATQISLPWRAWPRVPPRVVVLCAAAGFVIAATSTLWAVFAANPELLDETAQLFQARIFAAGRLAAPPPEPAEFFLFHLTAVTPAGWVAQFPPGHSALLALGWLAGAPWLVNPLIGGVCVWLVYRLGTRLYGPRTGLIAALLWALADWVLFMSASYMNHVSATAFALLAWTAVLGIRRPTAGRFAIAGCALALVAAIRPLDAIAAGIPIAVWSLHRERIRGALWGALGVIPVALAWGFVNWRQFGSPFTLGYSLVFGPEHGLGFHTDPFGFEFTPLVALSNMASAIRRLHIYLYEAPVPVLLMVGIWAALARHTHRSDRLLAAGIAAAPVLYLFYWHSGFFRGPRFYYIAVPLLAIALARSIWWAYVRLRRRSSSMIRLDVAGVATVVIVTIWGVAGMLPDRLRVYRDSLPAFKLHPERELKTRGVERAVVLVPESWLSRTVVDLWAMGAQPGVTELVTARADGCDLFVLTRLARTSNMSPAALDSALRVFLAPGSSPAPRVAGWPDPVLRLNPRPLPGECVEQMARDRAGFTVYGSLAWRNAVGRDEGIVFARDLHERNGALLSRYAGWDVWRFAPPPATPLAPPVLTRLARGEHGGPD